MSNRFEIKSDAQTIMAMIRKHTKRGTPAPTSVINPTVSYQDGDPPVGVGFVNPMTTTGDVMYANETDTPADASRLGIGTENHILTVISGIPGYRLVDDRSVDFGLGANQINSDDVPDHNGHSVKDTFEHVINRAVTTTITVGLTGGLGIDWTAGEIYDESTKTFITTTASSGNLTDNSVNYLKWASGTGLTIATSTSSSNEILVAVFSVYDGVINGYRETSLMNETLANTRRALRVMFPSWVISGMVVSEDTDVTNPLDVVMTAGVLYKDGMEKKSPVEIKSRNTALVRHFHTGGAWDYDTNAEIDTSNYDNGTNLAAIPNNKWVKSHFMFMNGKIGWVYPRAYYNTKADAIDAPLPTKPPGLEPIPNLTAIVYQQGAADFTDCEWQDIRPGKGEEIFTGVTIHNDLASLQGGTSGEYYHMTEAESLKLVKKTSTDTVSVNGYTDVDCGAISDNAIDHVCWVVVESIDGCYHAENRPRSPQLGGVTFMWYKSTNLYVRIWNDGGTDVTVKVFYT